MFGHLKTFCFDVFIEKKLAIFYIFQPLLIIKELFATLIKFEEIGLRKVKLITKLQFSLKLNHVKQVLPWGRYLVSCFHVTDLKNYSTHSLVVNCTVLKE